MNSIQKSIIKKVLLEVEKREIARLEYYPKIRPEHSKEYNESINAIIEKMHKRARFVFGYDSKRKATILIAAILAFALMLSACVFREKIKDFVFEIYESFTRVSVLGDPKNVDFEQHLPRWMPEEYTLSYNRASDKDSTVMWTNEKDDSIFLFQNVLSLDKISWDTEGAQVETVDLNGITVHIMYKNNTHSALWIDGDYSFFIVSSYTVGRENLERIITSILE